MLRTRTFLIGAVVLGMPYLHAACGRDASARPSNQQEIPAATRSAPFEKTAISLASGIDMHFVERGRPDGETVIFLHGYTDTGRSWFPVLERLEHLKPALRLIALDQRGHGASSLPDNPTCEARPSSCFETADFAADVIAFMDAMNIERAHVVGHSLGTFVAQELALTRPDRVDRIVMIATTATIDGNPAVKEFMVGAMLGPWREALERKGHDRPRDVYRMTPLDVDSTMGGWLAANWVTEISADPAYLADIAAETKMIPLASWFGVIEAIRDLDNAERLESLSVPALILWPVQDAFFTANDQSRLLSALDVAAASCSTSWIWKQYGKVALPESGTPQSDLGHNLQWGAPGPVAEDIASYLTDGSVPATLTFADPANARTLLTEPATPQTLRASTDCRVK
jgi:pimeloyl-ACP methyl ester carboxylesterase